METITGATNTTNSMHVTAVHSTTHPLRPVSLEGRNPVWLSCTSEPCPSRKACAQNYTLPDQHKSTCVDNSIMVKDFGMAYIVDNWESMRP